MQITRLHHAQITIPRGTEEEARKFYCGLLGLIEIEKPNALKSRGGFWLQVADQQVHLGTEPNPPGLTTKAHLAYQVDDIRDWRARIEEAGFETQDNEPIPGHTRFEIRDPFGNRIEFIQPLK